MHTNKYIYTSTFIVPWTCYIVCKGSAKKKCREVSSKIINKHFMMAIAEH